MAAKIVAVSHVLLATILVLFARTILPSQAALCYAATVTCAVVAYGCWTRRRWIAALGAVPLSLFAIAAGTATNRIPGVFTNRESSAIAFIAFAVVTLEIVAIVVAGKSFESADRSSG